MNEEAIKKLINIYSELEAKLLDEIVEHFKINEEFINSDYWKAEKLKELGLLNENIVKYISEVTNRSPKEIERALNKIGFDALNINNLNEAYKGGLLKINPSILFARQIIQNLINYSYNETTNRFIEISNKIENATRETYLDIVEKAYIQTSNGISYQEAIRNSLLELGNKGITTLTYKTVDENGNIVGIRNYDIEGTVRRELVTATHNLTNNINQSVAEELDAEYLYLSEHVKCRPTHFPWQGTIIKRKDLVKVTRLGEVDGMGGPNCKHYPTPYFGIARGNELKQISLEEATKQYDLSQKQRYLEKGIRKWKRRERIFKNAEDKEYYKKCKYKVKEWQLRNKEFTEDNDLRRDFTRENVEKIKYKSRTELDIPNIFKDIANKNNQEFNEEIIHFIDNNIVENDIKIDYNKKGVPFAYDISLDKIVINPNHEDIEYYPIPETLAHEVVHLKDIRNNIIDSNYELLDNILNKAKLYIDNNTSYYYNFIDKYGDDMSICDVLSALSKGKITGDFGHSKEYWKDDYIILRELSSNLISSKLSKNGTIEKLLEEIPPLKILREECLKLWEVD